MRYKAIVSYDGTNYHGYQRQPRQITVQQKIEEAFEQMLSMKITTFAASRTDRGVHAKYQVIHFDCNIDIPVDRFLEALNRRLPLDIKITRMVREKEDFHARHSAQSKVYTYHISKAEPTPFDRLYAIYIKDFKVTNEVIAAMKMIEGTHDFRAFSPMHEDKPSTKTIYTFNVKETKTHYHFKIHGNHFLKYMVRSIMGNLIAIGTGKKDASHIHAMLKTKNRKLTAKTAPAQGLFLYHIYY